ncbi:potassium-transporting ATPase A chain [Leptospira ryugenii]|uniref:Potassium-transporting ATPase potassium-binding subunit n=2 Tax=Leptospira ryugenii TaxID=1917863 RepID=A0A2P2DZP7_9LEPT|nr:potassium-transporting ATPase A chain [Leptospira ryugenii]
MAFVFKKESIWGERKVFSYLFSGSPMGQSANEYLRSLLVFHGLGGIILFGILMFQDRLPLNPLHLNGLSWHLALNTTISFITNTNWQAYSGESQLSYFSQTLGLAPQNFYSAAVGISVLCFVGRGLSSSQTNEFGNFWVDLYRATFYILLPLSILLALVLVSQGVVQSFDAPIQSIGLDGFKQTIPLGPAASQISIKQLGTNGGGFFGVNSAHPFENPTAISNFLESFSILFLPAASIFLFGKLVGSFKHAWVIFFVMLTFLFIGYAIVYSSEVNTAGIWEGKETRFSWIESTFWMSATTAASNGSVNAMHDSFSPLAGSIALFQMMIGEVIFGGVGTGMYGMFLFIVLTVFLSGLMTGRTPELFGKKIGSFEMKWTLFGILAPSVCILIGSAISTFFESGYSAKGPHALSQILYAYSSASGNNGSAFAGFAADSIWGNLSLGVCMLVGRFSVIASSIYVAASLGKKITAKSTEGSFRTDTILFGILLFSILILVCGLTFFPFLTLGPILEHFLLGAGKFF